MLSLSSSCKSAHASPSVGEQPADSVELILTPNDCRDQGQMLSSNFGLIEMTEAEFSDLQHIVRGRTETQAGPAESPDTRPRSAVVTDKDAANSTVVSPLKSSQAIDLSVSSDDHCLLTSVEKTPSYGEVPGFVLARISREDSPATPIGKFRRFSKKRFLSSARVCLEKRFQSMCPDITRQPAIHPTLHSSLLTAFQQTAEEAEETAINAQRSKGLTAVGESPPVGSRRDVNPVCGQILAQQTETNKQPGLVISKSFSFHFYPDHTFPPSVYTNNNLEEEQIIVEEGVETPTVHTNNREVRAAADSVKKAQSGGRKRARSQMSQSQRREKHNVTERERRKRIRLCCDELNTMVPFCEPRTDKVTTLTWTTTFLRYITKKYGDTFKEEFGRLFAYKKDLSLNTSSSSDQNPTQQEVNEPLEPSLAAEQ